MALSVILCSTDYSVTFRFARNLAHILNQPLGVLNTCRLSQALISSTVISEEKLDKIPRIFTVSLLERLCS